MENEPTLRAADARRGARWAVRARLAHSLTRATLTTTRLSGLSILALFGTGD